MVSAKRKGTTLDQNSLKNVDIDRARHADVVDERNCGNGSGQLVAAMARSTARLTVLYVFAKSNSSGMWAHGNTELGGHEENGEDLVDSSETARVDLANVDGVGLKELLEGHAVVSVLSGGCG